MKTLKGILIALFAAISCGLSAGEFTSLSVAEFETAIKSDSITLVDVRTPAEYNESHIEGAINIDVKNPEFSKNIEKLDKAKCIAVYCRSGKRSKMAANTLSDKGYKVIELNPGILGWNASGKAVVK